MAISRLITAVVCATCLVSQTPHAAQAQSDPVATFQSSGTTALLQAISPVDESIVWVSGHEGTWGRTTDGGETWATQVLVEREELQFRDVDAFDANHAYLLSAGEGPLSRIFRTRDGGETWDEQFIGTDPATFLDCMAFWDVDRGVAYGDAIDGSPFILRTANGGETWARVPARSLPTALEGEGGFAASGSCVQTAQGGLGWVAAGNAERTRVFRTMDYGTTWTAVDVPVVSGAGSGLTTIGFTAEGSGFAIGGTIGADDVRVESVATSGDGGATWASGGLLAKTGPAYGASWVAGRPNPTIVAVGPGGVDLSDDGGATWRSLDTDTYWAVAFHTGGVGWTVGPNGRITRWEF